MQARIGGLICSELLSPPITSLCAPYGAWPLTFGHLVSVVDCHIENRPRILIVRSNQRVLVPPRLYDPANE
jgi:hypothetical protein